MAQKMDIVLRTMSCIIKQDLGFRALKRQKGNALRCIKVKLEKKIKKPVVR